MKALAIILNVFLPGVGTLVAKKIWQGITQLLLGVVGIVLTVTMIGAIIGLPLLLGVWIWAIVSAATWNPEEMPDSKAA
jgi:TM2 domain-containing membrane protein YozV